jgi:pimeloyl-ACP methyl ester carboxylesterase
LVDHYVTPLNRHANTDTGRYTALRVTVGCHHRPSRWLVIDGAGHYDLYDQPEYVDRAVGRLEALYNENLKR